MLILSFQLAGESYGLNARDVQAVAQAVAVVPLSGAPGLVEGVIDVHGTVTPVLDVRRRFGHPTVDVDPSHHFILARAGNRDVAFHVDHATELVSVAPEAITAGDGVMPGGGELMAGVARLPDGLVVIHDLHGFLSDADAAALDEALAQKQAGDGP